MIGNLDSWKRNALPALRSLLPSTLAALVFILLVVATLSLPLQAQTTTPEEAAQIDPSLFSSMRWRSIGPYRAGRVSAVAGISGDPSTYYMGTPGGGVWKTTDGGITWKPIFDKERVASIGAVAVAPSDPNIIYVGTGEQTDGNGMYKSTDAGATWTHVGLENTHYISSIIVNPRNPEIVVVGVLGHPILSVSAPNPEKGVFKTTDGGKTWAKTLYQDEMAGVSDLAVDPENPRVLYAALWHPADWRSGEGLGDKPDAWMYKSTDEGSTWKILPSTGMPAEPWGKTGLAVAPGNRGQRIYSIVSQGVFRSDDGGAQWRKINNDSRVVGNFYFSRIFVDPRDADVVYVMQTTMYRSTDGGVTFEAFKGAPGGDDYHVLWIDPQNSRRMILGVDQGSTISVDGGRTWSPWFNQPTGQFYHVITDNQFPYISYAPQQDSGTVAIPNRSDYGEISFRDWFSVGGFEYCYIAPDPLHPNIIYSGGWYGAVVRFDKTTGQVTHVFINPGQYHANQMAPLVFSPQDPHILYFGTQYLMQTENAGATWETLSPDLTVRPGAAAGNAHAAAGAGHTPWLEEGKDDDEEQAVHRPATLTTIAPSLLQAGVIWTGSSNGVISLTEDGGGRWGNVTPAAMSDKASLSSIDASHYDINTAFASAIITHDAHPYIYRTTDAGKSWQAITSGLPDGWTVYVVREDPVRRGMLYAGTENGVYVSFDNGDHWRSLQLNLPTATVRDLVVHGDNIVIATYGRGLWTLDDITPLRQSSPRILAEDAYLYQPENAVRVRYDNDQETPLPPEVPTSKNPPDGAIFDYFLKSPPAATFTLEIRDSAGKLVKRFTSDTPPPDTTRKNVPDYWFGPIPSLSKNAGANRFVWDLRYDPPPTLKFSWWAGLADYVEYTYSDHALPEDTPREQTLGPIAIPGQYEAALTVDGKKYTQPFSITLDPRVQVSQADLEAQLAAGQAASAGLASTYRTFNDATALAAAIADREKSLNGNAAAKDAADALKTLSGKVQEIIDGTSKDPGVSAAHQDLSRILFMIESGDAAPSDTAAEALARSCSAIHGANALWRAIQAKTLPSINSQLEKNSLKALPLAEEGTSAGDSRDMGAATEGCYE